MKTTIHRTAKARTPGMTPEARRRLHAALQTLRQEPLEIFSDREEDAAEYDSIVRDFEAARDEELSVERYN
jgi:hypothetical protein